MASPAAAAPAPTVTDANLLLGRLDAERFLGGELKLEPGRYQRQMQERIAGPLGLEPTAAADGILRIAVTQMSHAVKAVTTERGLDAAASPWWCTAAPARCTPRPLRASWASARC